MPDDIIPWVSLVQAGIGIGARIAAAGLAAGWVLRRSGRAADGGRATRSLLALWAVCTCGVVVNALLACVLGEFGRFTPAWDLAALIAFCGAGGLLGWSRDRAGFVRWLRDAAPGVALLLPACALLLSLQTRGEWIAGGWDPGVYVNQGLALERTGRHDPGVLIGYGRMDASGFDFFTRGDKGYRECFPAVPIDPGTREVRAYFFRLMPSWIAVLARCGGAAAAVRVNLVTGMAAVIALAGMILSCGGGLALALFAALLFSVHPLLLYHLSVPTTELLQVVLVCGLFGVAGLDRRAGAVARAAAGAVLIVAAVLNRVSFVPFGALFLLVMAWVERHADDRRRVVATHSVWGVALAAGAAWTWTANEPALHRLLGDLTGMSVMSVACLLLAVGVDAAAATPAGRTWLRRMPSGWPRVASCAAAAVVGVLMAIHRGGEGPVIQNLSGNLNAALPYVGWVLVGCGLAGGAWLAWRSPTPAEAQGDDAHGVSLSTPLGGFVAFAGAITALLMVNQSIAPLYPWATRRYLEFTVPLLCLLAAVIPAALWNAGPRRRVVWRVVAALVLAAPAAAGARRAANAWRCTSYDGLIAALEATAARIAPGDTVVADDPRWGTPLLLGWGLDIINGKPLCAAGGSPATGPGVAALRALSRGGRSVRLLTSTAASIGIFGESFPGATLDATVGPMELKETVHSGHASDFATHPRAVVFRLYSWKPADEPGASPAAQSM